MESKSKGFTLIELIVVVAIMALMATLLIINFNSTRPRRNLALASNELATNIRKAQSYALSARNVSAGVAAKYYVVQFDFSTTSQYKILAVDTNYTATPTTIETITLPTNVALDQASTSMTQNGALTHPNCLQILFGLPFGRVYMVGSATSPCNNNFVTTTQNPSSMQSLINSTANVYLKTTQGTTYYKYSIINGTSGTISTP